MAHLTIRYSSAVIGKQTEAHVLVPDTGTPPFPVLYLLHGLSDDSTTWTRLTRLEAYAAQYPLIIAMPDGYRGFYTDHEQGPAFGRHIGEEFPALIERLLPAHPRLRSIGGLSMGGYGALRIGLESPGRFRSIHSHSGALGWGRNNQYTLAKKVFGRGPEFLAELRRAFGPRPDGTRHDLLALAKAAKAARKLPAIRLDCGTEDFLLETNRKFVAGLRDAGIPHHYSEHPGAHDWQYWDTHIQAALAFHAAALLKPKPASQS